MIFPTNMGEQGARGMGPQGDLSGPPCGEVVGPAELSVNITVLNPVPAVEHPAPVVVQRSRRLFRIGVGVFGLVVTFANWTLGAWGVLTNHPAVVQYVEFSFVMTDVVVLAILGSTLGSRGFRAGLLAAGVLTSRRRSRH